MEIFGKVVESTMMVGKITGDHKLNALACSRSEDSATKRTGASQDVPDERIHLTKSAAARDMVDLCFSMTSKCLRGSYNGVDMITYRAEGIFNCRTQASEQGGKESIDEGHLFKCRLQEPNRHNLAPTKSANGS